MYLNVNVLRKKNKKKVFHTLDKTFKVNRNQTTKRKKKRLVPFEKHFLDKGNITTYQILTVISLQSTSKYQLITSMMYFISVKII